MNEHLIDGLRPRTYGPDADAERAKQNMRADGRVDCILCGSHGARCQADRDDGTTVCEITGRRVPDDREMLAVAVRHDPTMLPDILAALDAFGDVIKAGAS